MKITSLTKRHSGLSLYLFLREREACRRAVAAEQEQSRLREQAEAGARLGEKLTQAGLALSRNRFEEAEEIVNQLPSHPAAAGIFNVLGVVHAHREQWSAAVKNYTKVVELRPTDHEAYHFLAPLLVQTGDLVAYRRHCERILRQFAGTSNPVVAERMAKDCLFVAPPAFDFGAIEKLVGTPVAAGPTHQYWPYFQFVKGLAEYRQGRFASAADWYPAHSRQNRRQAGRPPHRACRGHAGAPEVCHSAFDDRRRVERL